MTHPQLNIDASPPAGSRVTWVLQVGAPRTDLALNNMNSYINAQWFPYPGMRM
eukprot:COSAG01_NODE_37330_length_505_cov_0.453202_1_plen_52_part_10